MLKGFVRANYKKCSRCLRIKHKDNFGLQTQNKDGLRGHCKDCKRDSDKKYREQNKPKRRKWAREWRLNNKERYREYKLVSNYGLSLVDYSNMLEAQNGTCAICDEKCPTGKRLAVDHCHTTGKVRGLLCFRCNAALGKFDDCTARLARAIRYLLDNSD